MLPILQIGPLSLQTPGLFLLLAVWIGLGQTERLAKRSGQNENDLYNLVLIAMLAGVLGARLVYAGRNLSAFITSPISLLSLNTTMLDGTGGLVVAALAGLIYAQRKHLPLWRTLDMLTPALAILLIGLGLAHLASGDAFGAPTRLPWGIYLWGEVRHPSQVYEIISAIGVAAAIWPRKYASQQPSFINYPGARFLVFVAASAGARLFLEMFRGDSTLLAGTVRTAQVAAWLILAAALWFTGQRLQDYRREYGSNLHP